MKRLLFIFGIVLIIVLTAVWVYLLFFNTSTNSNGMFNLFDFGDTTDPNAEEGIPGDVAPVLVDTAGAEALRQLTTKPVVGFTEVQKTASSSPLVYFVEAGTGHVFTINIETGEENRVSNITVPVAQLAEISKDGKYVVVKSGEGQGSSLLVITLAGDGTASTVSLDDASDNFSITDGGELLYAVRTTSGTLGKMYNFTSKTSRTIFEVPLREVMVLWGNSAKSIHYLYPNTASRLEGAVYSVTGGTMDRLPISGYGISARANNAYVLYAKQANGAYGTYVYDIEAGDTYELSTTFIPEKCAFAETSASAFCAGTENAAFDIFTPDTWYQGTASYVDDLWSIDVEAAYTELLLKPLSVTGREIDVVNPEFGATDDRVYFKNKNDQTLWLFDSTPAE